MRYQSPVANPLCQYWEEDFIFGGALKFWKVSFAGIKYFFAEYFLANVIFALGVFGGIFSLKPVLKAISRFYYIYGFKWGIKRAIDMVGALIGVILATPLFIIIPILIKLDSSGPIFFRQERIGKNRRHNDRRSISIPCQLENRRTDRRQTPSYGKPFMIFKFRTMYQDAEKQTGPVWAVKNDPRITRVGAFLRATRIDEIPQLFNVLKGDMSLVGPRPERAFFIKKLRNVIDDYDTRLLVRPGLKGLAQVKFKYDESEEDTMVKVKYDLNYIRELNIIKDLGIILKTVYVVLAARGM